MLEQTKPVPLTIKCVGLALLAWCSARDATSTHNIHEGELKFFCPPPSANRTRFSSLVGHNVYEERENQHFFFVYLFTYILMEDV